MATKLAFSVHADIPHDTGRMIDEGLGAANEEAAPLDEVERLACFARLPSGEVVGGAIGRTWGECCELQQLWVDRAHRRQGIGTRIVEAFEQAALERGCRRFYLETFSFQAPALYTRLGYGVKLAIGGFPQGIVKYVMMRETSPD